MWVPILSFHQCGGNVGDACNFPIPAWIWTKYIGQPGVDSADDLKYKSEEDHLSTEVVSVWGTRYVIQDYANFMIEFQRHFAAKAESIAEINISLGPAGELRYPSYNAHDPDAGYPSRGRLQSYSNLAKASFRHFMIGKYGDGLPTDWLAPPHGAAVPYADDFFAHIKEPSLYRDDFFEWYSDSLLSHGRTILSRAVNIFNAPSSAFLGIDIGAKVPGVHWRMSIDRAPELAAGLIRTKDDDAHLDLDTAGHGYYPIIHLFREVGGLPRAPQVTMHFTCLEMDDGSGGATVGSLAQSLVFWVAQEAHKLGVPIKGENALAGAVNSEHAWTNMDAAVEKVQYQGLTVLRMGDIYQSQIGTSAFQQLIQLQRSN